MHTKWNRRLHLPQAHHLSQKQEKAFHIGNFSLTQTTRNPKYYGLNTKQSVTSLKLKQCITKIKTIGQTKSQIHLPKQPSATETTPPSRVRVTFKAGSYKGSRKVITTHKGHRQGATGSSWQSKLLSNKSQHENRIDSMWKPNQ